ncbi:DUF2460 domain-containing protein [Stappia sp. 28M-7]|uniref:DUF2460 domain-containing protein n=1 Tax=Stappia sp. 28M-7 TaxID=2762596 RepID=UPI00163BBC77|nr:DUF2460 domain-containing protein [Stappia sp. 28M-7]MBC2858854.1 DUF2460 domain-containing protein [Stappia sp. 28M-7]
MTPGFIEERFPLGVAFGASGGPQWRTDVVTLASGAEMRNARWAGSRRRYDAGSGVRSLADLQEVAGFFERMRGRLIGFRFRDPFDNLSAATGNTVGPLDCRLGTGDGARVEFPLAKSYGAGEGAALRRIEKPVAGSVRVAVGGSELAEGTGFTCDPATGLVTLSEAPAPGAAVTAGFRFDVPVRFDTDRLELSLTHFEAGRVPTIPLVEITPDGGEAP